MASTSPTPRYALPVMLGILGVSIVIFTVALVRFIANGTQTPDATPPATTAQQSPVVSTNLESPITPSTTPRPSWTPPASATITITRTPTPTLTRTLVSSLTPANPQTANTRYRLVEWSLLAAEHEVEIMTTRADREQNTEWYRAAVYALQEALLRFPQSINAAAWRWQMAHYQILAGDARAIDTYASLIQAALQTGQARINDLPAWFQRNAPELRLSTTVLPAQPGELNRLLIQISGRGYGFIWSLGTPGNIQMTPLLNNFDHTNNPRAASLTADLTGDGHPELILYETSYPSQTQFTSPWIFDLTQEPPALMPIQFSLPLELGTEAERLTTILPGDNGENELLLTMRMFPTCPVDITRSFQWDGEKFSIGAMRVEIHPEAELLSWCEIVLDHASLIWAPELTLAVAEPLLGSWPPSVDTAGDPYPEDGLDALRFRVGILHALAGHQAEAIQAIQSIIDQPSTPQSSWIEHAHVFVNTYQQPEDLYQACQLAPGCNLHHAIQEMVRSSGINSPAFARQYLLQHGVVGRTAGYFDFDGDGVDEAWLNLRPTAEGKLEFWILVATTSGVQAVYVQVFESNAPQPYYHDPDEDPLVIQLERGQGFVMRRDPLTGEAAIQFVDVEYSRPTFIRDELNSITQALFLGVDPAWALAELLETHASPRFAGDCVAYGICARFYYTLGLVYQLTGDQLSAIDWYLTTWWEYPLSPYTLMARLKLELIPATPTSTPTITQIPTITYTPDPNRTNTPTSMAYPPLFTPTPHTPPAYP